MVSRCDDGGEVDGREQGDGGDGDDDEDQQRQLAVAC